MGVEIKLPDLGEGIEAGDVLAVLVSPGDDVERDQSLVELETDKATVEVPCPQAGRITQVHVQKGQTVKVGATLVSLDAVGATAKPVSPAAEPPPPPSPPPPPPPSPQSDRTVAIQPEPPPRPAPQLASVTPVSERQPVAKAPAFPRRSLEKPLPAGPAIRRFAREVGVDLAGVNGTGEGGRITREDVLDMVRRANRAVHGKDAGDRSEMVVPGQPSMDDWGPIAIEPASRMRKTIAAKMHESWSTVPRVTNFDDADVTELEKIRKSSKDDYAAKGIKLTSMPFLIKAVSMALRKHPVVNAAYDMEGGQIIYKRYINVGVAVDTERGLLVPPLRNTDQMSISEIARTGQYGQPNPWKRLFRGRSAGRYLHDQ